MKITGGILWTFVLMVVVFSSAPFHNWNDVPFNLIRSNTNTIHPTSEEYLVLKEKAYQLKQFAKLRQCNRDICFLIDMHLPSGKNRFFVYDMKKDSVNIKGLVAHGSCDNGFAEMPVFSNTINSGCSSLGKYKIGNSYKGRFGLAYKLSGLDSSNSTAWQRNIVLHSYDCVPAEETDPEPICNSRGCPMISPGFLKQLKQIIDKSKKPILIWIFR